MNFVLRGVAAKIVEDETGSQQKVPQGKWNMVLSSNRWKQKIYKYIVYYCHNKVLSSRFTFWHLDLCTSGLCDDVK